ncbi:MAG TPA: VCBS repeat-containing protein [Urbifossiella sp.]|nr:VCBS repeat-containing protein [Urbifossiella sp.]
MRILFAIAALLFAVRPAAAYVEAPMSLGSVLAQSTHVVLMTVTKVDQQQNLIIFQKVQDIKGKHPQDTIKHNIGRGGLRAGEWQEIMKWAEVGKKAVFFHNGGASETFIGVTWYQAYPQGEWWGMSHGEPFMLRSYAGKVDKLPAIVADLLANKEVIVPCMVDGDKEAIHKKIAKIQRVKASLKIQDYNPKRDFVGWGGEDIRRLQGMPGFDRMAALPKLDAEAQSISVVDFDNDGKPDVCLCGASKVVLMQNGGDSYSEVALPGYSGGARSAVWADHNGDGLPDLLLATPDGPRLFTNLGKGQFRDDSKRLPREAAYNLTAAAWGDFDGDGKPDVLLGNGFHGLRLYRNIRPEAPKRIEPPKFGDWHVIGTFRAANPADNFKTAFPVESEKFTPTKEYRGKRNLPAKWAKKEIKNDAVTPLPEVGGNCATYLHVKMDAAADMEFPVSIGTNGTLTVWVNENKVFTDDQYKPVARPLALKLKKGSNTLLVKMCDTVGNHAFRFALGHGNSDGPPGPWFEDATAAWGLGNEIKGDTLTVADFNNDGRPDFLYGAGTGMLYLNAGGKFALKPDSGIAYKPGKIGPAPADFDSDGNLDLFIPQADGKCRLFRGKGDGSFSDVPCPAVPGAVSAAWGDFDNDGQPDLVVCCLKGSNRYFKNIGNGAFEDKTAALGLSQKVFNSQAAALADLNGDGQLDLILNNEAQDSAILFGAVKEGGKTPVVIALNGTAGLNGGKVIVKDSAGKAVATACICGGESRGGNQLLPRFVLAPGQYNVEVLGTKGKPRVAPLTVAASPMNVKLN